MSIRLCVGELAKTGYEPENMGIRVYSLEELCFFIRENAAILDEGFLDEGLARWLEQECQLKELAEEVKKAWQRRISLKAFVGIILSYAGFYPEEVNQEIEQSIGDNSHVSMEEKRKIKADMLLSQKKYAMAGREYARLLASLPEDRQKLRGEIYQSCGICLARMFSYEQAGEYFLQAHRLTGKIACYKQYLWTKRLSMTEEEFIRFLKQHEEAYEDSLEIDRTLEELNRQWSRSNYALLLQSIREEKEKQDIPAYRRKLTERVEYLKDAYREMVSQTR